MVASFEMDCGTSKERLLVALKAAVNVDNLGRDQNATLSRREIESLLRAILGTQFSDSLTQLLLDAIGQLPGSDGVPIASFVDWIYSDDVIVEVEKPSGADPDEPFLGAWFQDAQGVTLKITRTANGRLRASWEAYSAILQRCDSTLPDIVLEGQGMLPTGATDKVFRFQLRDAETLSVQIRTPKLAYPSQLARRIQKQEPSATDRYLAFDAVWDALQDRSTVLVKGSWLMSQSRLPRRQDLPEGSTWEPTQLKRGVESGDVRLVALSHCWVQEDHPDPSGQHLSAINAFIAQRLKARYPDGSTVLDDLAVFIDWCSLVQNPCEAESDRVHLENGMRNMDLWFVHQSVELWLIKDLSLISRPYGERGWPEFERRVSSMLKPGHMVHDLSEAGVVSRMPPLRPDAFADLLQNRTFANAADSDRVAKMYERIFSEVMGNMRVMSFRGLRWDDAAIVTLAESLPYCSKLEALDLGKNAFGKIGCVALAAALPQCLQLSSLRLDSTPIGDAGIEVLAPELPQCRSLREISFSSTEAGNSAARALAGAIPRCSGLQTVRLENNMIGDAGSAALCTAFPYCHSLKVLELSENKLTEKMMTQSVTAWRRAGKPA